jgi:TM2 domain-containing membrane protein YozV
MFCKNCGKELSKEARMCPNCGQPMKTMSINTDKNKWVALLLWLFLGGVGAHQFYVGNNGRAIWYIVGLTVGWLLIVPPFIVGIQLVIDLIDILQGKLGDVKFE